MSAYQINYETKSGVHDHILVCAASRFCALEFFCTLGYKDVIFVEAIPVYLEG